MIDFPAEAAKVSPLDHESRIVVTPHSWSSVRTRFLFFLGLNALGMLSFAVTLGLWFEEESRRPGAERQVWRLWVLPTLFLAISLTPFAIHPASWVVDGEGITRIRQFGKAVRLRWAEVDRVLWIQQGFVLKGIDCKISFQRPTLAGDHRRAWEHIKANLLVHFDLTPVKLWYTREECKRFALSYRRTASILGIAVASWGLIGLGLVRLWWTFAWASYPQRTDSHRLVGIMALLVFCWMSLLVVPMALALQRPLIRAANRIHPSYPWRHRKPVSEVKRAESGGSSVPQNPQ